MLKKYIHIFLWIAVVTLIVGDIVYSIHMFYKRNVPKELIYNIKRSRIEKPEENNDDFKKLLYDYSDVNGGFSKQEIEDLLKNPKVVNENKKVSKEDAACDTETLFKLLKYNYAGYKSNGGDETFENAEKNIIGEINNYKKDITVGEYCNILIRNFNFINDGHFEIINKDVSTHYIYFTNEDYKFLKDKYGYFTYIKMKKYYLYNAGNKKPEEILKMSLDKDGKVVYYPGVLERANNYNIPLTLNLKSSNKKIKKDIILKKASVSNINSNSTYSLKFSKGIPILSIRSFSNNNKNDNELKRFVSDIVILKKHYNLFVIDLRGNTGGSDVYPESWFHCYTGQNPENGTVTSNLITDSSFNATKYETENILTDKDSVQHYMSNLEKMRNEKGVKPGWSKIEKDEFKRMDNKNTIVVLTDSNSASAAEYFISYLRILKNVIFVGSNTYGALMCGNCWTYYLPASKTPVYFGNFISKHFGAEENKGFMPDIWVNPDYSMDRVIKFIKNYKLKNIEK